MGKGWENMDENVAFFFFFRAVWGFLCWFFCRVFKIFCRFYFGFFVGFFVRLSLGFGLFIFKFHFYLHLPPVFALKARWGH